jgi:hypothetical protein
MSVLDLQYRRQKLREEHLSEYGNKKNQPEIQ